MGALDGLQNYMQEYYADRPLPDSLQVPAGTDPNREANDPLSFDSVWSDNPDVDNWREGVQQSAQNTGRVIEDTARISVGLDPDPSGEGDAAWVGRAIRAAVLLVLIYVVGQLFTFNFHVGDGE